MVRQIFTKLSCIRFYENFLSVYCVLEAAKDGWAESSELSFYRDTTALE